MATTELPWVFTEPLERAGFDYMVVGAYATMAFGVYRTTSDLDLVIDLRPSSVREFEAAFPIKDFYCPPRETLLEESLRTSRGHFNLVHQTSQERADCYLPGTDSLQRWALQNRRALEIPGGRVWVAPPELVILKKLEFFQEGGSEKHLRDIRGICAVVELDQGLIEAEIERRGLRAAWIRQQERP